MIATMRIILSLVILCVVSYVTSQTEPKILNITSDQWVTQKDTVALKCEIQNSASGYPLSWKRRINSTVEQISTNATVIIKNNRFAANFDSRTSTYKLKIDEIEQSDIGTYICEISFGQNRNTSAETKIDFFEEASYYNSTNTEVEVKEGSNFTIECYAYGKPKPTITITRYDAVKKFSHTGNELKIEKITKEDEGNYTCEADTPALTVKRNIGIMVIAKPIFLNCNTTVRYAPEFSTEFICMIDSVPSVEIFWFRDGKNLKNGDNVNMAHNVSDKKLHKAKLNIFGAESGVYSITAKNTQGDANRTFAFSNGTQFIPANSSCCEIPPSCGSNFWIWVAICAVVAVEMILNREQLKVVYANGKKWCEERFRSLQGDGASPGTGNATGPPQGLNATLVDCNYEDLMQLSD